MKRRLIKQSENITLTLYQTVGHLHTDYSSTLHMTVPTASSAGRHEPMRNSEFSLTSNAQRYQVVCGIDSANQNVGAERRLKAGRNENLTHMLDVFHSLVCCKMEMSSVPWAQHKKVCIFYLMMAARPASET